MHNEPLHSFVMYRFTSPTMDSDYPVWAVTEDHAALIAIGDYALEFALAISTVQSGILATDCAPTGERLLFDLAAVIDMVETTFLGHVKSGRVAYDKQLSPASFVVSLRHNNDEDTDLAYIVEGFGSYLRRDARRPAGEPVTLTEGTMLDGCISIFAELAARYGELLREPSPHGAPGRRPRARR